MWMARCQAPLLPPQLVRSRLHAKTNNSYLILFKRDYEDFIKKNKKTKKPEIFFPPNPMYYVVVLQVAAHAKACFLATLFSFAPGTPP
jgi:hypothetical protein